MLLPALLLSVLVGVSLGLLGGGGSILTVPILLYVVGLDERAAIAASLLVVGVTSIAAALNHARQGNVDWRAGGLFAAGGAAGAFAGGYGSGLVPAVWLLNGFVGMMIGTGIAMLRGRKDSADSKPPLAAPWVIVTGFLLGALTGMVGAGGGFVIVPALVLVAGLPMKRAVGTSLLVIAVQTLSGFAGHAAHATIPWGTTLGVMAAAVVGSFVGGHFAGRISPTALRRAFGIFVLAMAAWMILKQL